MLRSLSIRIQLRILLMLLALPSIALIVMWGGQEYQHLIDQERRTGARLVDQVMREQQAVIGDTRVFLKTLAQDPEIFGHDDEGCGGFLSRLLPLTPRYANIAAPDEDGVIRCSALPVLPSISVADQPYFRQAIDLSRFSVGSYQEDPITGEISLNFAYPVLPPDLTNPSGALVAVLSLEWWDQLVSKAQLPAGAFAYILDRRARVVAAYPRDDTLLGRRVTDIDASLALLLEFQAKRITGDDGVQRVIAQQAFLRDDKGHNVQMVVGLPVQQAWSLALEQVANRLFVLFFILVLMWFGIMRLLDHQLLRPLGALNLALKKLEAGRLEDGGLENQSNRVAEFQQIAQSYRRMSYARLSAENAEVTKRRQLEALLDALPDIYFRMDHRGYILDYKAQSEVDLVRPAEQLLGQRISAFLPPDVAAKFEENLRRLATSGEVRSFEYQLKFGKDLRDFEARLCRVGMSGDVVVVIRNITFQREARETLLQQARVDFLTNLPNRSALNIHLEEALTEARRLRSEIALLFVDLDGLKPINDKLGHASGDELIKRAAQRLRDSAGPRDFVARHAGDEFIILVTDDDPLTRAQDVAERIIERMQRPFDIDFETLRIGASVGMAFFPNHAHDPATLLMAADQAMYAAKASGGGQQRQFTPEIGRLTRDRLRLHDDLARALKEDHFELVYQPIIDLKTGRVAQAEALLRFNHPQLGPLSPDAFLPVAEELGLSVEIGDLVLRKACADIFDLRQKFGPGFRISINNSPTELAARASGEGLDWVTYIRENTPDDASVSVEITESALLDSSDQIRSTLSALRKSGVTVALDDFGAGYSSLTYFLENEFDFLKMDKAFVRGVPNDIRASGLCQAILNLAQHLGSKVIAEGIETSDQLAFFKSRNCAYAQGYFFSRAVPVSELLDLPAKFEVE